MTNEILFILYNFPDNEGSVQRVETVVNSGFRGEGKDEHLVGTSELMINKVTSEKNP